MKFLVTGCAGFIGSHLTRLLLRSGNKVVGIDSLNDYYSPEIKLNNLKLIEDNKDFTFIKGDITDKSIFNKFGDAGSYHGVFHIAGYAGVRYSIQEPFLYIDHNIKAPVHIFEWLKGNEDVKIVIASSSSIYGEQDRGPFKEGSNAEDYPISQYAASKRSMEMFGYTYHRLFGLNISFLRFFTVYGPGGRVDMAPMRFMVLALNDKPIHLYGDGTVVRDFTYVEDIVNGVYKAYEETEGYGIYNIGCGEPHSVLELIESIEKAVGKKIKISYEGRQLGDVDLTYANIEKANKEFNYKPETSLTEGIKKTYEWYTGLDEKMKELYLEEIQK